MATLNDTRNVENRSFSQAPRKVDKSTLAQVVLDHNHHEVHNGTHFIYRSTDNIATSGNSSYWYITTADTPRLVHAVFTVEANGYCRVYFGEYSSTEATINLPFLNNRLGSANTSEAQHSGLGAVSPTGLLPSLVTTLGRDGAAPFGGLGAFGSNATTREELILDRNTGYVIRFEALMDDVDVNLGVDFYEHEDKY